MLVLCQHIVKRVLLLIVLFNVAIIDPIHVAAMMNKKRGLAGNFTANLHVNRDVTSLLLHVPVT